MILELTTDNILTIIGGCCLLISGALGAGIRVVSNQNQALKAELDELRDCVKDTRENYVTNERFDSAMSKVDAKLDKLIDMIGNKTDMSFCDRVRGLNGLKK